VKIVGIGRLQWYFVDEVVWDSYHWAVGAPERCIRFKERPPTPRDCESYHKLNYVHMYGQTYDYYKGR
jgi:hypothetical protein